MPLQPDDTVCYCFHVPLRKIQSFCRIEKPRHASQISQCLSAGTGCGWCIPMLQKVHRQMCQAPEPWWRQEAPPAAGTGPQSTDFDDPESYAAARQQYIAAKEKSKPQP